MACLFYIVRFIISFSVRLICNMRKTDFKFIKKYIYINIFWTVNLCFGSSVSLSYNYRDCLKLLNTCYKQFQCCQVLLFSALLCLVNTDEVVYNQRRVRGTFAPHQ